MLCIKFSNVLCGQRWGDAPAAPGVAVVSEGVQAAMGSSEMLLNDAERMQCKQNVL